MNLLKTHITKILYQDLILLDLCESPKILPKFVKVTLSSKFSDDHNGALISLLEILTFAKPYITTMHTNSLTLNLRKGELAGCKLVLRKNHIFAFLERFIFEILPSSKKFDNFVIYNKYIHWQLKDLYVLEDTNNLYMYLQSQKTLDIVIELNKPNFNFFHGNRLLLKPLKTDE